MISSSQFGASLSVKVCRDYAIDDLKVIKYAFNELGIKNFRLMSYWDEIETTPEKYNFEYLDKQFRLIENLGGKVSLAVGKRQPRWPECHIPSWALIQTNKEWYDKLYLFLETTVERYKNNPALLSYQLENEALLKEFGNCKDGDYNRERLKKELSIIKALDKKHPVIMSLSNNWGFPVFGPFPDIFGFSLYRINYGQGKYTRSLFPAWWYKLRASIIKLYSGKKALIHELQTEPWGPKANHEMSVPEQFESMSLDQLSGNIQFAKKTELYPIYLWGLEWWFYLNSEKFNNIIKKAIKN
jgi:hypothetical protein